MDTTPNAREIEFTRVKNDVYGNPRVVCHFLNLANTYPRAIKLANSIGGRKFHNKQYGGGVVFQCYNQKELATRINRIREN